MLPCSRLIKAYSSPNAIKATFREVIHMSSTGMPSRGSKRPTGI